MLRVLIVEDEFHVGLLINKLIHWDELGLSLIEIADNGKDALEIALRERPDIIITDIRMAQMDGLELIRRIREEQLAANFIIISGYRYFEYAQQAIKFGVEEYLLKPINENDLNAALQKLCARKHEEAQKKQAEQQVEQSLSRSLPFVHRELFDKLLEHAEDVRDIEMVNSAYSTAFHSGLFQTIAIKLDHMEEEDTASSRLIAEKMLELLRKEFSDRTIEFVMTIKEPLLLLCLLNFESGQQAQISKSCGDALTAIGDYVFAFNAYKITMGISLVHEDFAEAAHSVREAIKAIQYRIVMGTGGKLYYDPRKFEGGESLLRKMSFANLANAVETFDVHRLETEIDVAFAALETANADPGLYYALAEGLIKTFFERTAVEDPQELQQERNDLLRQTQNAYTAGRLSALLKKQMGAILNRLNETQREMDNKPIREAKRYLAEHFTERVVLEDVANIVNLNPVYFSVVFKKETGMNFGDYLLNLRMEAAKALLRETDKKIIAVADEVGYKDARYFSQLFTKNVGINPAKYRKLYS